MKSSIILEVIGPLCFATILPVGEIKNVVGNPEITPKGVLALGLVRNIG